MELYSHYHETGYHGAHEVQTSYDIEANGHGTKVVITMTYKTSTTDYPRGHSSETEERFEIGGEALALLIRRHGRRLSEPGA